MPPARQGAAHEVTVPRIPRKGSGPSGASLRTGPTSPLPFQQLFFPGLPTVALVTASALASSNGLLLLQVFLGLPRKRFFTAMRAKVDGLAHVLKGGGGIFLFHLHSTNGVCLIF